MKKKVQINEDINLFFNLIIESVINEINISTNNNMLISDLKVGYKYKAELRNKIGHNVLSTIEVINYDPQNYHYKIKMSYGNESTYYLEIKIHQEDNGNFLEYSEEYTDEKTLNSLNFKFISFFYKRKFNKKVKTIVKEIEMEINARK